MLRTYYLLTKPGIVRGNSIFAAAGFLLAARGQINIGLFVALLCGLALVIASACVANNYLDRHIDAKMSRTKDRALVNGSIAARQAIIFAVALLIAGTVILLSFTNLLATGLALLGWFAYVVLYGIAKRRTTHGTLVGTISGAIPPVVGYTAVTGHLDTAAVILFMIVVFWQMPHFYAIAIFRLSDYTAAGIPVLPAVKGLRRTKIEILVYSALFVTTTTLLTAFGYTGYVYLGVVGLLGLAWLRLGIKGWRSSDDVSWAKKMFGFSLRVVTILSVMLALGPLLP